MVFANISVSRKIQSFPGDRDMIGFAGDKLASTVIKKLFGLTQRLQHHVRPM